MTSACFMCGYAAMSTHFCLGEWQFAKLWSRPWIIAYCKSLLAGIPNESDVIKRIIILSCWWLSENVGHKVKYDNITMANLNSIKLSGYLYGYIIIFRNVFWQQNKRNGVNNIEYGHEAMVVRQLILLTSVLYLSIDIVFMGESLSRVLI